MKDAAVFRAIDHAAEVAGTRFCEYLRTLDNTQDEYQIWTPALKEYALALFEGGAEAAVASGRFAERGIWERWLREELLLEIVERILPDRARREQMAGRPRLYAGDHTKLVFSVEDGELYQEDATDGPWTPAPSEAQLIYAHYGDLEYLLAKAGRVSKFLEVDAIRQILTSHLLRHVPHWASKVPIREATPERPQLPPTETLQTVRFPKRASWLKLALKRRGWSNSDPAKRHGPDHKTIRRILDGKPVRADVLERLAAALSERKEIVSMADVPDD